MNQIIFISDFFKDGPVAGGAELHDDVVISHLRSIKVLYAVENSYNVTLDFLKTHKDKIFIISNFTHLPFESIVFLTQYCKYILYEHDYKFIDIRNPIFFKDFIVPRNRIINVNFYKKALKIVCLSKMHRKIFEDNLGFSNIVNLNCSMWCDEDLEIIEKLSQIPKNNKYAIIDSPNPIKKTAQTIDFCQQNNMDFELISSKNYHKFMGLLAPYFSLAFMTGHPEPTPRIAIEAKMLRCNFLSQSNLISVAHEDYFHLEGTDMIEKVRNLREKSLDKIVSWADV